MRTLIAALAVGAVLTGCGGGGNVNPSIKFANADQVRDRLARDFFPCDKYEPKTLPLGEIETADCSIGSTDVLISMFDGEKSLRQVDNDLAHCLNIIRGDTWRIEVYPQDKASTIAAALGANMERIGKGC
jgi:hypothetical protein